MWVKRKGGEGRREERQEDEGTTMIIAKQTKQREKQYYRARGRWPGGNFQLKTNAYKCAHMEKAPPHTHVCVRVCVGENCDFACLFIGLRHLPSPSSFPPAFSCWSTSRSRRQRQRGSSGVWMRQKKNTHGIGTHTCGHNNITIEMWATKLKALFFFLVIYRYSLLRMYKKRLTESTRFYVY